MKRKSTVWIGIVMVLLAVFFVKTGLTKSDSDKKKNKDKGSKKVAALIVSPSAITDELTLSGTLIPNEEVELKNEVAGRIVMLNLPEGKFVRKGTLLVKFFDDDLQASLRKLQVQYDVNKQIYTRQAELVKINGVSRNEYEQTGLQLKTIQADIDAVKASIRKTEIKAPFDGIIGLKQVSEGAVLSGASTLASIRSVQKIKIEFSVPEIYSSKIHNGLALNFTLGNDESKVYNATVFASEMGIENSTHNLKVRAYVTSHSDEMISGAFANVRLKLNESHKALVIPTDAFIPQEDTNSLIVARKGKAHFVTVKTGKRTATKMVVSDGIATGDTVVLNGLQFLKEGDKLSYSTVKTSL